MNCRFKNIYLFVLLASHFLFVYGQSEDKLLLQAENIYPSLQSYFENPDEKNTVQLLDILPSTQRDFYVVKQISGDKWWDYLWSNFTIIENQVLDNNRLATKIVCRILLISSNIYAERVYGTLSQLIQINPKMFLEELYLLNWNYIDFGILVMRPWYLDVAVPFCDDVDYKIKALESVTDIELLDIRDKCLFELKVLKNRCIEDRDGMNSAG